jgi:hypothetical protein
MTETRNYHREIVEERDRLRVERDELLNALRDIERLARSESRLGINLNVIEKIARRAIARAEEGKS